MKKKIEVGDIFLLEAEGMYIYFQCVKEAPKGASELIRIYKYEENMNERINEIVQNKEEFFIEFPLIHALRKKIISYVGHIALPQDYIAPKYFRSKHIVRGEFICWHIVDSITYKRESVQELSEEQVKLSPWGFWPDTLIVERLKNGWKLEDWK